MNHRFSFHRYTSIEFFRPKVLTPFTARKQLCVTLAYIDPHTKVYKDIVHLRGSVVSTIPWHLSCFHYPMSSTQNAQTPLMRNALMNSDGIRRILMFL
ncbi:hypothetical protein MPER_12397 [Moniliophthora perniciosa FA553]|nr:hypothetical protein MPER_12397 [Moniliophthora perniciosa FA553]